MMWQDVRIARLYVECYQVLTASDGDTLRMRSSQDTLTSMLTQHLVSSALS